jgi:hypothetical protein
MSKVAPKTETQKDKNLMKVPNLPDFKKLSATANDVNLSIRDKRKALKKVLGKTLNTIIP